MSVILTRWEDTDESEGFVTITREAFKQLGGDDTGFVEDNVIMYLPDYVTALRNLVQSNFK